MWLEVSYKLRDERLTVCISRIEPSPVTSVTSFGMRNMTASATIRALDEVNPKNMRAAMGAFCSGVVVVTSHGEEPFGFTCQTFASLSLEPALISFSPARSSSSWPRIREVGTFAVNVLAQDHADLSGQFAMSGADKYAGVDWTAAPNGSPILEGVSAWVECRLWREYDGGDHTIVIGEVTSLWHDAERNPLLYYRGSYLEAAWKTS
jgi:3-hydroxy-9,10-secoandrosta-1,3,5(10)-triene-9,17-dione monooxygenase reductase component